MIPDFDENGYLPSGIHLTTLDEVIARFGIGSDERIAQGQALRWLLPMCRRAGIIRWIINGSFTTAKPDPVDADCLLLTGPDYDEQSDAAFALEVGLPYLSMIIVQQRDWDQMITTMFSSDRRGRPKGMVEVEL